MGKQHDKDERLPNGSVIYWTKRFKGKKDRWRVPVRCGKCREERTVDAARACQKRFTGLCHPCSQGFKTNDEILSNGSVIYWSKRFKDKDKWYVPIRCGNCGEERLLDTGTICNENFRGLCYRCARTSFKTKDETLPNDSMVCWSRRFKHKSRWHVPVKCGNCGEERFVTTSAVFTPLFSGLCQECANKARRFSKTGAETLANGSIIYWGDETFKYRRRAFLVRCGGCGSTRYLAISDIRASDFTGLCPKCGHAKGPRANGGLRRRINSKGYIVVKLSPDHPFYCMTDNSGYVLEHRLVVAQQLGCPLTKNEIVHHINGNKQDNRPENLSVCTRAEHITRHTTHGHPFITPRGVRGLITLLKELFQ